MTGFFDMGGYGAFVWPSYVASILVIGFAIVFSVVAHRRTRAEVRRLEGESGAGAP